ncbi:hypothetical protein BGZ96_008374, partial [Linnemannia gamsii]
MGARVYKLSNDIESAVDVVSESSVKVDADKAKAVHGFALAPPLRPDTTKPARDLHKDLTDQVEARFVVDTIPDATLVAIFLNPGCFDFTFFDGDSQHLIKAKDLALSALLELALDIEKKTPSEPVTPPKTKPHSWKDIHHSKLTNTRTPLAKARAEFMEYYDTVTGDTKTYAAALDSPQNY